VTLSINGSQYNSSLHRMSYAESYCAQCRVSFIVMLSVIMLSVGLLNFIMLSFIMLSVITLSVIMLSVVAPSDSSTKYCRNSGLYYKYITIVNDDVSDAPKCVVTYDLMRLRVMHLRSS
jgi:hypothetical protein